MLFRSDRKSTRLNSSHTIISYAVFCLRKKTRPRSRTLRCPARGAPPPRRWPAARWRLPSRERVGGFVAVAGLLRVPSRRFFNDAATTEIYTLSLHDALPI